MGCQNRPIVLWRLVDTSKWVSSMVSKHTWSQSDGNFPFDFSGTQTILEPLQTLIGKTPKDLI